MVYTERDLEYFTGERFKPQFDMILTPNVLVNRLEKIIEICSDKNIVHIGCCDHISVIDEKMKNEKWLHGLLDKNCPNVIGIDICSEAVEYCNNKRICRTPIIDADCRVCKVDGLENYDIVLMAEMIEHINNPVDFLIQTYSNFSAQGFKGKYVITAPNALGLIRRNIFKKGYERINTDHKYWFSPYTLAKIMAEAGITPESCEFVQYGSSIETEESYMSDAILVIGH